MRKLPYVRYLTKLRGGDRRVAIRAFRIVAMDAELSIDCAEVCVNDSCVDASHLPPSADEPARLHLHVDSAPVRKDRNELDLAAERLHIPPER